MNRLMAFFLRLGAGRCMQIMAQGRASGVAMMDRIFSFSAERELCHMADEIEARGP